MHKALDNIFFIFGDARSGNTFLSYQIMAHMKVIVPPESNFIANVFDGYKKPVLETQADRNAFVALLFKDQKFSDWRLSKEVILERLAQASLSRGDAIKQIMSLYCERQNADVVAFGIQKNYIQLYPKLRTIFPQSRIIHIMRDGRAVFNSQKNSNKSDGSGVFEGNPVKAARNWIYKNMKLQQFGRAYNNVLSVQYENLVTDIDGALGVLAKFLMLDYYAEPLADMAVPERYGDIHNNVGTDAKPARLEAWKQSLSAAEIKAYEAIAGGYLSQNGYALFDEAKRQGGVHKHLQTKLFKLSQDTRFALGRMLKNVKS